MFSLTTQILSRRQPAEDDRLLRLFWNRAELKKEFAKLARERDLLTSQLRQQEGATLRAQQRLEDLEALLSEPAQAANVAVFYQLRSVWQQCRRRLLRLATELSDRQRQREHSRECARFEEHRRAALAAIEQRIEALKHQRGLLEGDLEALRKHRRSLFGFWNISRRRRLAAQADAVYDSLATLETQLGRYSRSHQGKEAEPAPAPSELSVEGKRAVNLTVIALAQELVLQLTPDDIARRAREASLRQATEVAYGGEVDCRELSAVVVTIMKRLDAASDLKSRVSLRAAYLGCNAEYRQDGDTVPVAGCLSQIPHRLVGAETPRPADGRTLRVNVLADDYWDLCSALLT